MWPRGNATATATAQPEETTRQHNEELLHFVGGPAFANIVEQGNATGETTTGKTQRENDKWWVNGE